MASRVPLSSLPNGTVLIGGTFQPAVGATAYVYLHATTTTVTVYAAETGAPTLSQPLTTGSTGQLPGYVIAGQDLDVVATYAGATAPAAEVVPLFAADILGPDPNTSSQVIGGSGTLGLPSTVLTQGTPQFASKLLLPSGGDDSAAVQAAITAMNGYGSLLLGPGTFLWNTSSVTLPRGASGLTITALHPGATTCKLGGSTTRFFDCPYVADYDQYQNIWIEDLIFDASAVTTLGGLNSHLVLGNFISGNWKNRANFSNINVRRCRVNGALVNTSGNGWYAAVSLGSNDPGGSSQTNLLDITVEDLTVNGCNIALVVAGNGSATNVFYDRLLARKVIWNTGLTPQASWTVSAGACVQFGANATGGRKNEIVSCQGTGSPDVTFEIDCPEHAVIDRCVAIDSKNQPFMIRNFNTPPSVERQKAILRGCRAAIISAPVGSGSQGYWLNALNTSPTFGSIILEGCSMASAAAAYNVQGMGVYAASAPLEHLTVNDFEFVADSIADTSTGGPNPGSALISPTVNGHVAIRNWRHAAVGSTTNASLSHQALLVGQGSTNETKLDIDGIVLDNRMTGGSGFYGLVLGKGATGKLNGRVKGVRPAPGYSGPNPSAVVFLGATSSYNTIGKLSIEGYDGKSLSGGTEISIDATQAANVTIRDAAWHTPPAPSSVTGLTTAVGATSGKSYAGIWVFTQASGAGITSIDFSTDGGTTYTNALTQASGAMPSGADLAIGPLPPDALVKVTFATTQPTIKLVPVQ